MLKKLAEKLGLAKLNFQVLRRTMATLARNRFFPLREGSTWKEATAETHKSAGCRLVKFSRDLVRFGTVGIFDGLQVIESKALGA